MANDNVYVYTLETIENYYPRIMKIKVANNLIKDGIATKNKKDTDKIFIGDKNDYNRASYCLKQDSNLIKYIENWEYDKYFKYSIYFMQTDGLNVATIINECVKNGIISVFNLKGKPDKLGKTIAHPVMREDDDGYYLKFVTQLETVDTTGIQKMKRNVAIIYISKTTKLIEIRFDAIETVFSVDRITYINNLITWLKTYIDKEATGIDLTEVVEEIRLNGEKDGVIVSEQHMEMASGSEATVSIGKNEARQLPFISEIKSIMEIYSKELESVPELKKALDDFLYEKEELSTYPWITFLFEEKRFEVKITMDYNGMGIDLLQHYSSSRQENVGRERMEHVTNYIIEVGKRINMQWS